MMQRTYANWVAVAFLALVTAFVNGWAVALAATPVAPGGQTFASAREAVETLLAAVAADDEAGLLAIFGPGAGDLISSGDRVADKNGRARFSKAYADRHSLEEQGDTRMVLHVGTRDYAFPIPLVRQGGLWSFDTGAGKEEILNRRIGGNELHTIKVLHAYVDAQREYSCRKGMGGAEPEFARKLTSSEGKEDGLYWRAREGEPASPFGPLIAEATEEGYLNGLGGQAPEPFHGYYFKILPAQGAHATGGAFDYVVDGKMILGFGLVAYPARYGSSGIMTFMVNQAGVIYEKDLGRNTPEAEKMTLFDPDDTWKVVRDQGKEDAGGRRAKNTP